MPESLEKNIVLFTTRLGDTCFNTQKNLYTYRNRLYTRSCIFQDTKAILFLISRQINILLEELWNTLIPAWGGTRLHCDAGYSVFCSFHIQSGLGIQVVRLIWIFIAFWLPSILDTSIKIMLVLKKYSKMLSFSTVLLRNRIFPSMSKVILLKTKLLFYSVHDSQAKFLLYSL